MLQGRLEQVQLHDVYFSLPKHWAGIRDIFPEEVEAVKRDEETLGFTLDNKKTWKPI